MKRAFLLESIIFWLINIIKYSFDALLIQPKEEIGEMGVEME